MNHGLLNLQARTYCLFEKKIVRQIFCLIERKYQKKWANNLKGIINNLSIILFNYCLFIYRSVQDNYFLNEIKYENPFTMLAEERLLHVHVFQIFWYFHVWEFSYSYWFDVMWCVCVCVCVNKRDVEKETKE